MLHLSFKRFQNKYTGKGGLTTFVQSFRLKTNNTMNVPWRLLNKQVKLEKKNAAMIVFFRIICYSRKKQMSRQLIWFVIMKFDSTGTSVLFRLISRLCVSCSAPFFFPGDTRLRRRWNSRGANTKQTRRDVNSMHHLRRCVTNRLPGSAALKTAIGRGKINTFILPDAPTLYLF